MHLPFLMPSGDLKVTVVQAAVAFARNPRATPGFTRPSRAASGGHSQWGPPEAEPDAPPHSYHRRWVIWYISVGGAPECRAS